MEYENLEIDFIKRTLSVLKQNADLNENSFDVTLYINSLIGLIVLPKEKGFLKKYLPNERIEKWGLKREKIRDVSIKTIKDLSISLRHSVAHFDIEFGSDDEKTINRVIFKDSTNQKGVIAEFDIEDFKVFVELLAETIVYNADKRRNN